MPGDEGGDGQRRGARHVYSGFTGTGRGDVVSGVTRRRRWSREGKAQILTESFAPGASVSDVAPPFNVSLGLVHSRCRVRRCRRDQNRRSLRLGARNGRRGSAQNRDHPSARVVIGLNWDVQILVVTKLADVRKGINGLTVMIVEALNTDRYSGTIYVFRSKAERPPENDPVQ
jgi:transposase-like protein